MGEVLRLHARETPKQDQEAEWLRRGWTKGRTEAEEERDDSLYPQERVRPIKALLAWIECEFPEIAAQYVMSSSALGRKASLSGVARRCVQRKGKSAQKCPPLSQVQPLKVSKPRQRKRRPFNEKWSTTRDEGQVEENIPPKVALRRSERISQQAPHPESLSRGCPESTLRRSTRILDRTKKPHLLGSDQDTKPTQSSTIPGWKSRQRTTVHTNAAHSGTLQRISKTQRRKGASKKRKDV
ncbi:hypothetical protein P154DRAFT_46396 [Amniculicola lignicola CBS 123094]|uniref:Uncharacterized protein n=1 Tax=Amniculicola lignicola CBS 123094 TaxID=1392246 RepID=A0A6A5W1J9_9PLEO|nr:hypothetical protein P154DRAFT_46396 [Amniculicola lignicola CBS 123094]